MFSLGLQPYPLIGPSEIGDYIKSGKILDKPQLSSDEMYISYKCDIAHVFCSMMWIS